MLLQKPLTKKDKRKILRQHRGLIFVFIGLIMIITSLFFAAFLEKPAPIATPISKNQTTQYLKVEKILKDKHINYKTLDIQDDLSYKLVLNHNEEIFLDSKKDVAGQLSSLQLILSQLKIEGKTFRRLDFRFEKPVIAM